MIGRSIYVGRESCGRARREVSLTQQSEGSREHAPLEGRYANYFSIGHNAFEFIIDVGQSYSEGEAPRLHTRIIITPVYAKALLETLRESLDRYEESFGSISNQSENGTRNN